MNSPRFQKVASNGDLAADDSTDYIAVIDTTTSLMWARETLPVGEVEQPDAEKAAAAVDLLGKNDWRLPTRTELLTLVDDTRYGPAIDPLFECKSDWYWTSTAAAYSPADYAWFVFFSGGFCFWGNRSDDGFVRAVRPSQ